jgi:hypothetical protein
MMHGASAQIYDVKVEPTVAGVQSTVSANASLSSLSFAVPQGGVYTLRVAAVDVLGHRGNESDVTLLIDLLPPASEISTLVPAYSNSRSVPLSVTGTDDLTAAGLLLEVQTDNGTWSASPHQFTADSLSDGLHLFRVRATDGAGNRYVEAITTVTDRECRALLAGCFSF